MPIHPETSPSISTSVIKQEQCAEHGVPLDDPVNPVNNVNTNTVSEFRIAFPSLPYVMSATGTDYYGGAKEYFERRCNSTINPQTFKKMMDYLFSCYDSQVKAQIQKQNRVNREYVDLSLKYNRIKRSRRH